MKEISVSPSRLPSYQSLPPYYSGQHSVPASAYMHSPPYQEIFCSVPIFYEKQLKAVCMTRDSDRHSVAFKSSIILVFELEMPGPSAQLQISFPSLLDHSNQHFVDLWIPWTLWWLTESLLRVLFRTDPRPRLEAREILQEANTRIYPEMQSTGICIVGLGLTSRALSLKQSSGERRLSHFW